MDGTGYALAEMLEGVGSTMERVELTCRGTPEVCQATHSPSAMSGTTAPGAWSAIEGTTAPVA